MKCHIKKLMLLFVLIAFIAGCSESTNSPKEKDYQDLKAVEKALIEADNKFGFKLFNEIVATESDQNVFISPLSISMALGMTLNGANGETRQAMEETLELTGLDQHAINQSYKNLMEFLYTLDPNVDFQIANSIWYRLGLTFEQEFINLNKTYFDAEVADLDFNAADAADIINGWVEDHTNGRITDLVESPIKQTTIMFLINAIFFNGTWTYQFDKANTKDDYFTLQDGTSKTIKMMTQKSEFRYLQHENFQAIDLPYGNGDYCMTIFLPNFDKDIDDVISDFSNGNWNSWLGNFSEDSVIVQLPRFNLEYELELNDVLKALGMEIAFNAGLADFTKMDPAGGIYISLVKHKSFLKVNEEGTEAAAATVVVMDRFSNGPTTFRVDRPFILTIRETNSESILFIGKVVEPM